MGNRETETRTRKTRKLENGKPGNWKLETRNRKTRNLKVDSHGLPRNFSTIEEPQNGATGARKYHKTHQIPPGRFLWFLNIFCRLFADFFAFWQILTDFFRFCQDLWKSWFISVTCGSVLSTRLVHGSHMAHTWLIHDPHTAPDVGMSKNQWIP